MTGLSAGVARHNTADGSHMCCVSANLNGGGVRKMPMVLEMMAGNEIQVAFLQDVGVRSDATPCELERALRLGGMRMLVHGVADNVHRNVALVVPRSWRLVADSVRRDGHGSLLGAAFALDDEHRLFLCSAYMPPGLDSSSVNSEVPRPEQREAQRIADTLQAWLQTFPMWLVGGDFNETYRAGDRVRGGQGEGAAGAVRAREATVLGGLLETLPAVDCFARAQEMGTASENQFTREQNGARARLDYVLCSPAFTEHPVEAVVVADVFPWAVLTARLQQPLTPSVAARAGALSDHHALVVSVTCDPELLAGLARSRMDATCAASAAVRWPRLKTRNVSAQVQRRCRAAINCAVEQATDLFAGLDRVKQAAQGSDEEKHAATTTLDMLAVSVAQLVYDSAKRVIGAMGGGGRRAFRSPAISEVVSRMKQLMRLRDAVLAIPPHTQRLDDECVCKLLVLAAPLTRCRPPLVAAQLLTNVEAAAWRAWLEAAEDHKQRLRRVRKDLLRAMREPGASAAQQFQTAGGRKNFYERCLRARGDVAVDCVNEPVTGKRTYAPERVRQVVRDVVSAPFSQPADGPPEPQPAWWAAAYSRTSKMAQGDPQFDAFARIMDPAAAWEVWRSGLAATENGKSPGHDGVPIEVWKWAAHPERDAPHGLCHTPPALRLITEFVNATLALRHVAAHNKRGLIKLLPKVDERGAFSADPARMRPITLLPELGKIVSRVLAARLANYLATTQWLTPAQRAFVRDGSIFQSLDATVNAMEDAREHRNARGALRRRIYLLHYDLAKAYDRVQRYSVRAALVRFNMPQAFIDYVSSLMSDATSRVLTGYGPTEPFDMLTGIRQGEPLSPLLFVLFSDMLHCGFEQCPLLCGARAGGYRFAGGSVMPEVVVCSSGYADDNTVLADSWEGVTAAHAWECEFLHAHRAAVNYDKSHLLVSEGREAKEGALELVDHWTGGVIRAEGPDTVVRLTGLHVTLSLDWAEMRRRMTRQVLGAVNSIYAHTLNINMATACINEYLLPKLELGLRYVPLAKALLKKWRTWLCTAVLAVSRVTMRATVSREGLSVLAGLFDITNYGCLVRGSELYIALASHGYQAVDSTWARVTDSDWGRHLLPPRAGAGTCDRDDDEEACTVHVSASPVESTCAAGDDNEHVRQSVSVCAALEVTCVGAVSSGMEHEAEPGTGISLGQQSRVRWADAAAPATPVVQYLLQMVAPHCTQPQQQPRAQSQEHQVNTAMIGPQHSGGHTWVGADAQQLQAMRQQCEQQRQQLVAAQRQHDANSAERLHPHTETQQQHDTVLPQQPQPRQRRAADHQDGAVAERRRGAAAPAQQQIEEPAHVGAARLRLNRAARVMAELSARQVHFVSTAWEQRWERNEVEVFDVCARPVLLDNVRANVAATSAPVWLCRLTPPPSTAAGQYLVAFTDGSTRPGRGEPSGFAAVVCGAASLYPTVCSSGVIRASGNNYLAECMAVRVVLQMVPVNVPLLLYSDALSVIQELVTPRWHVSERKRLRAAARPVVRSIQRLLACREASTVMAHVPSHLTRPCLAVMGNNLADHLANKARKAGQHQQCPELLFNEERVLCRSTKNKHVIGDVRGELERCVAAEQFDSVRKRGVQGELCRACGLAAVAAASRWTRALNNSQAMLFFTLGVLQWLPVNHRLAQLQSKTVQRSLLAQARAVVVGGAAGAARGGSVVGDSSSSSGLTAGQLHDLEQFRLRRACCHRCAAGEEETVRHVFTCAATRAARRHMHSAVHEMVLRLLASKRHTLRLPPDRRVVPLWCEGLPLCSVFVWFDCELGMDHTLVPGRSCARSAEHAKALTKLARWDPLAGLLGMWPPNIDQAVALLLGLPDPHTCKETRILVTQLLGCLRRIVFWSSLGIYKNRCYAEVKWWNECSTEDEKRTERSLRAGRGKRSSQLCKHTAEVVRGGGSLADTTVQASSAKRAQRTGSAKKVILPLQLQLLQVPVDSSPVCARREGLRASTIVQREHAQPVSTETCKKEQGFSVRFF